MAAAVPAVAQARAAKTANGAAPIASGPEPAKQMRGSSCDRSLLPINPAGIPVHASAGAPPALPRSSFSWPLLPLQRKLAIGSTTDPLEAEADRVADQVMKMSGASPQIASGAAPSLRRTCSCGGSGGECPECKKKREEKLQLKAQSATAVVPTEAPPIVHQVLRSPGQQLDSATRAFFEPRLGHDLSHVRVHADAQAAESAHAVQARAYAVGDRVAFAAGQYSPHTVEGRRLLAHELAHVEQQRDGAATGIQRAPQSGTDVKLAHQRGQAVVEKLQKQGKLSKGMRIKVNRDLRTFKGAAKQAYLGEVKPALVEVGVSLFPDNRGIVPSAQDIELGAGDPTAEMAEDLGSVSDEDIDSPPAAENPAPPESLRRYIDNIFESAYLGPNGATTFYWKSGGKEKKITIPATDFDQSNPKSELADSNVYRSKAEALKGAERLAQEFGSGASLYYAYYDTDEGVIMPISFSERSAPKLYALWPDLAKLAKMHAEDWDDMIRGLGMLANSINPFPCTEVDENGHLRPSINLGSCALPILLHAVHSRLATHGPGSPGGETEPRTGGKSGQSGSEPHTEGKSGGAEEHSGTKPEDKPAAPAKDQAENKAPKDEEAGGSEGALEIDEDIAETEPEPDPNEKDVDPAICFPAGTLVSTCNGLVAIEAVQTGDLVYAFDETSRTVVTQKVRAIVHGSTQEWVKIGTDVEELRATKSHPFWVESEQCWIPAEDLRPGMVLLRQNGETLPVVSVELLPLPESEKTYNLSVESAETFFVGQAGILVHNIKQSRIKYLNRPGYRNYVLRAGGPTGKIYYSGMFGPGVTPAQVQYRHRNNHNRFKPENGDYFELKPGTRTYGESRLMEQKMATDNTTVIGRKGENYRGNRQDPLAENRRKEYNEYKRYRDGCG